MIKLFMKKRLLFITFLFIGICTIILIRINSTIFLDEQKAVYDNLNKMLNSTINSIKQDALSFSLAATAFPTLKEAIITKNKEAVTEILNEINDNLNKSFKNKNIRLQILTKEHLYCTSNKDHFSFDSYSIYFDTVSKEIKQNKSTIVQTQKGIQITVPVVENGEIIAFFDLQMHYEVLAQNMRKHKVEVIALLDKQQNNEETNEETITFNTNYIVANQNYNKIVLNRLITLLPKDINELLTNEYLYHNELFFALYDMKNTKGENLGKYVAIINQAAFDTIKNKEDFFLKNIVTINNSSEDFYNFVKHKEENMFLNIEKGYIKNLKDVVDEKDKSEFEEVARQKLMNLSKEELVDFILQQSKHSDIKGQIR